MTSSSLDAMANRVAAVRQTIHDCADACSRQDTDITLVAVSKTKPIEDLRKAYAAGIRHFGENRTEELAEKAEALADLPDITWHFIGRLQSRQTPIVSRYADMFHALDRLKLAYTIAKQQRDAPLPVFVQINISGEEAKAGIEASDWQKDADQRALLVKDFQELAHIDTIDIRGLMTMLPFGVTGTEAETHFASLRDLAGWLREDGRFGDMSALSMGMSGDYPAAINAGSTHVRVGSAIFGARG